MAADQVPHLPSTFLDMMVSEHAEWTCKVHVAKLPCNMDSKGPKNNARSKPQGAALLKRSGVCERCALPRAEK